MDLKDLSKDATQFTKEFNDRFAKGLNFDDKQDFEDVQRGFVARLPEDAVKGKDGHVVWALDAYDFQNVGEPCPDTVNPSLWRQSQINHVHGLFKVTDRIYQVRGMDMSNLTIIEGDTGVILIDPLCSGETAEASLNLYFDQCGKKEIRAILITHSHIDHYAGIEWLISEDDVKSGRVQVIVPENFVFEVESENAFVGTAMSRRAIYQYGSLLPKGPKSQVDVGLGKCSTSGGSITLLPPSKEIKEKYEKHTIDGIEIEFVLTPGAEAPVEFVMFFPQFNVLQAAEEVTHTLHNVLTLRGAQVRDTRLWWKIIDGMLDRWGEKTEIICASHHWPTFGHDRCEEILTVQRDMYKYMHDQCVRMINHGLNMVEIAEEFEYPPVFQKYWHMRGYYGSTNHDCKAVYQRYLGWYDANPSNLHTYPPEIGAPKYVDMMGGADAMLQKLQGYFEQGDYRWVAEVGKHLVFADPTNQKAANLLADAYEQLAYQCENGTWRNAYLSGATELRIAPTGKKLAIKTGTDSPATIHVMSDDMFYDFMTCRLNGPKSWQDYLVFNINHTNSGTNAGLMLRNGVLLFNIGKLFDNPDATLSLDRDLLTLLVLGKADFDKELAAGNIKVDGDAEKFKKLLGYIDIMTIDFNIVLP